MGYPRVELDYRSCGFTKLLARLIIMRESVHPASRLGLTSAHIKSILLHLAFTLHNQIDKRKRVDIVYYYL
jgi:hypothetical protein